MEKLSRYLIGILTREVCTNGDRYVTLTERLKYFDLIAENLKYHGITAKFIEKAGDYYIQASQGDDVIMLQFVILENGQLTWKLI